MFNLSEYISSLPLGMSSSLSENPFTWLANIEELIQAALDKVGSQFRIVDSVAIHESAVVEVGVIFNAPVIIGANCRIGAHSYFRKGVILGESVKIGPSSEVKSSIICSGSAIAHMNYIGNSLIGKNVNFEAGSISANHFNEREVKNVIVKIGNRLVDTKLEKFGSIVGDYSKIGANAVLSPGTILDPNSVVGRLELVRQVPE